MFGKALGIVGFFLGIGLLTGCGFMLDGQKQIISVATINDKTPSKTRCLLQNEEGMWKIMPATNAIIDRGGKVLYIQCVNTLQTGENQVAPTLDEGIVALDFFTMIGVAVDAYYKTFYAYPPFVTVLMKDKMDVEFINPSLQRGSGKNKTYEDSTETDDQ